MGDERGGIARCGAEGQGKKEKSREWYFTDTQPTASSSIILRPPTPTGKATEIERAFPSFLPSMASKLVIALVFVFDLIAFGLAVAAEQRRSTATFQKDSEDDYTYCVYDSDIATGFGVGALLFLLLSQVILMAVSKCFCCGRGIGPSGSRACALLLFLLSWLTFLIAEACLLAGSVRNAHHTRYRTMFFDGNPSCETLRKGVFAAGAAFVFFTAILSEFYYITFSKATRDGGAPPYGGPAVGMSTYK